MVSRNTGSLLRQIRHLVAPPDQPGHTDHDLLQRFATVGDEEAFVTLLRRHAGLVWGVCRRVLGHEQDAEDAFQGTFLVLARKAASIHQTDSVRSWLYGVAYHIASNVRRGEVRRRLRDRRPAGSASADPVSAATLRELQVLLDAEVARLPEKYRAPFVLCCLEGKSKPEVAQELGLREGTVASRVARARQMLQQRLTRRGLTLSAALCAGSLWEQSAAAAVPRALIWATARAAAGGSGGACAGATALAEGVLKAAWLTQWRVGALLFFGVALVAVGAGVWGHNARSTAPPQTKPGDRPAIPAVRRDLHGDPLPPGALARLGTLRQRAAESHLAVTPDGKEVVAVGPDLTVRRFDAQTGELRTTQQLPRERSPAIWLSPSGKFALTSHSAASGGYVLELWDLASGKCVHALSPENSRLWGAAFSGDERSVAVADSTGNEPSHRVLVWNLQTANSQVLWSAKKDSDKPCFDPVVTLSPDGERLAARHLDGVLRCWEVADGKLLWESKTTTPAQFILFSPDGQTLVSNSLVATLDTGISRTHFRDAATGKLLEGMAPPPEAVYPIGYSPDGRFLAFETKFEEIVLWEPGTARVAFRFASLSPPHDSVHYILKRLPTNFAFTPDGKGLIRRSGTLQRWDLTSGKAVYPDTESWGHREEVTKLVFSPDGRLLASSAKDQQVRLWEVAKTRTLQEFPKGLSDHLGFTPDGRHLLTMPRDTREGVLRLWGLAGGKQERVFDLAGGEEFMSFEGDKQLRVTPDGKRILILTWKNGGREDESVLTVWDVATGDCLRHERVPWGRNSLLSPDGESVLAFDFTVGVVKLLRVEPPTSLLEFQTDRVRDPRKVHRDCDLALSPDGHLMAARVRLIDPKNSLAEYDDIRLGDMRTGEQLMKVSVSGPAVFTFSPDGRLFAVAGGEGIRFWETTTGKEIGSIPAPNRNALPPGRAFASSLAFSPDGRMLATGHSDSTILLWDATLRGGASGGLLGGAEAETLWADLAGPDAGRAYAAVWRLVDDPQRSVLLLRERLKALLAANDSPGPLTGLMLRQLRGIQVLERIGSPEAHSILERLAAGIESARLTQEAKEALARMPTE
jgi:RNA polymerase sigma factor (sigma-70 family)